MPDPDAATLIGLLAEPDRLKVAAAIALGARRPEDIADVTGLGSRRVMGAVGRLTTGGLVLASADGLVIDSGAVQRAARKAAPEQVDVDDPDLAAVLRAFLREGRLTAIPVSAAKRRVLLEHLVLSFGPGVRYPEREVNAALRAWHDDHAALRRYLVEAGLLARDHGVYWRTGGAVPV